MTGLYIGQAAEVAASPSVTPRERALARKRLGIFVWKRAFPPEISPEPDEEHGIRTYGPEFVRFAAIALEGARWKPGAAFVKQLLHRLHSRISAPGAENAAASAWEAAIAGQPGVCLALRLDREGRPEVDVITGSALADHLARGEGDAAALVLNLSDLFARIGRKSAA